MLRFDIPNVDANAYRIQAALTFAVSALYLFTPLGWLAVVLAFGGLLRGFVSPHACPSYRVFAAITRRLGRTKMINAGAKMFADKIVALAGAVMLVAWIAGSPVGQVPAVALLVFSFIDLLTGFCVACWAYGLWYRLRGA